MTRGFVLCLFPSGLQFEIGRGEEFFLDTQLVGTLDRKHSEEGKEGPSDEALLPSSLTYLPSAPPISARFYLQPGHNCAPPKTQFVIDPFQRSFSFSRWGVRGQGGKAMSFL